MCRPEAHIHSLIYIVPVMLSCLLHVWWAGHQLTDWLALFSSLLINPTYPSSV